MPECFVYSGLALRRRTRPIEIPWGREEKETGKRI